MVGRHLQESGLDPGLTGTAGLTTPQTELCPVTKADRTAPCLCLGQSSLIYYGRSGLTAGFRGLHGL